jgi:S1-C subfamily serine protease
MAGGILASGFLMPYLAHTAPFDKISWLNGGNGGTTIINKTEEKIIKEDKAIEDAISRISPAVVGIVAKNKGFSKAKNLAYYSTGFIVTSDGLVVGQDSAVPAGNYEYSILRDEASIEAEVIKRDAKSDLVLLKFKQDNLSVVSFGDTNGLLLGEKIILVGVDAEGPASRLIDLGFIKRLSGKDFFASFEKEGKKLSGGPIINLESEVVAMALVSDAGNVRIITVEDIEKFLNQQ